MGAYGTPEHLPGENNETPEWGNSFVNCKKCGFRYSKSFINCPKCGAGRKSHVARTIILCILGILVVSIIALSYMADETEYHTDNAKQTSYEQKQTSKKQTAYENPKTISKEEYIASCENVAYEDIARNPAKQTGKNAVFTGEVVQVIEGDGLTVALRVNTYADDFLGYIDDTIYVEYTRKSNTEDRILEDDIVTMYGEVKGTKTYTTVLGNQVTIPYLAAKYIEIES